MSSQQNSPGSPRTDSPRMGHKDGGIGEITNRIRRIQPTTDKNRRGADSDDDKTPSTPPTIRKQNQPRPNNLQPPSTGARARSKSPNVKNVKYLSPSPSKASPSPRASPTKQLSRGPSPSPSRQLSRGPSPSPSRQLSRGPSPSPLKQLSRGPSPSKHARSPMSSRCPSPSKPRPRSPMSPNAHISGEASSPADLNDPDVRARVGNRATKVVDKPTRNCDGCRKALTEDGCTAFGKVYHKECFKCFNCKQKLESKFFNKNDEAYCTKCYKVLQEECCVCKHKIVGDCVVSNSKFYHPGCMKCHVCGDPLKGQYFTFMDKPICEKDYLECQQTCSICQEKIDGTYYTFNDKIFCEKDYKDQGEACFKCKKTITGEVIKVTDSNFHPECFNCETCNKNMVGKTFSSDQDHRIYCPSDYTNKFAAICSFCSHHIVPKQGQTTAPRIRALGKDFHPSCFKCEDCAMVLDSGVKGKECYPYGNHVLCKKCNRAREEEDDEESTDEEN